MPGGPGREAASRWRAGLAAAFLLGGAALTWIGVLELGQDPLTASDSQRVLQARWAERWNEFISGSEQRGGIILDHIAAEIPNPESIDF